MKKKEKKKEEKKKIKGGGGVGCSIFHSVPFFLLSTRRAS